MLNVKLHCRLQALQTALEEAENHLSSLWEEDEDQKGSLDHNRYLHFNSDRFFQSNWGFSCLIEYLAEIVDILNEITL